jgi:alpha-glucosidase (family GH31 glycosyl hydrolase)
MSLSTVRQWFSMKDTQYPGPGSYQRSDTTLTTPKLILKVNAENGCIDATDRPKNQYLTTICPRNLNYYIGKGLSLNKGSIQNAYGVAQFFVKWKVGSSEGDWLSHGWFATENGMGNNFAGFPADDSGARGANSQVQFPVMYAIGNGSYFAFFFDNVYRQEWNFNEPWITVTNNNYVPGGQAELSDTTLRFYVMTGDSLLNVRKDYMELTGKPPVPPRKAFGLWLSEFSYDNWGEIDWKLTGTKNGRPGLRAAGFPIDGFVLDLQWYGGVIRNSPDTRMGSLEWDPGRFPNPDQKLSQYRNDHIGFIAIEQSYVGKNQWAYGQLQRRGRSDWSDASGAGYLIHYCGSDTPIEFSDWFGQVGMIDWSEPGAGDWVHTWKRKPNLIDKGVTGHWTDLGEPEKFYSNACYNNVESDRFRHADVHNLYNFFWHRSIYDGYVKDRIQQRPFLLARAGAPGIQRFGAAMWSGDITSRLEALANHWNAQMHMAFNGIDYYGSDIGGFWRQSVWGDRAKEPGTIPSVDDLYTQWYAASSWTDVPVRPHTYNCGFDPRFLSYPDCSAEGAQAYETSPAWIGSDAHVESHRFATRQRYELIPYYYSLAQEAYNSGSPVIAPPVMYFPEDANVRQMGHQKMIGPNVLVALVAKHGQYLRSVYLPRGTWINYHTQEWTDSNGQWTPNLNIWSTGKLVLPAFVKAGTILPLMYVDGQTKDAFGHRLDGTARDELILKVYADPNESSFTLWEDDGATVAQYDPVTKVPSYQRRSTAISQVLAGDVATVRIAPAQGGYPGAVASRNQEIRLVTRSQQAEAVTLNGAALSMVDSPEAFAAQERGWLNLGSGEIRIKTGVMDVAQNKEIGVQLKAAEGCPPRCEKTRTIVFIKKETAPGQDLFLRGGLDHGEAAKRGITCTADNKACAIPMTHRLFTSDPNRLNDTYLDWYGAEPGQMQIVGTPLVWTTNQWPESWGPKKTVEQDGHGETPLNRWGPHYWMLDVDMDCSRTVNGWFELKGVVVQNGRETWESDIRQTAPGQPYSSVNHFGQCGKVNVFEFDSSGFSYGDVP